MGQQAAHQGRAFTSLSEQMPVVDQEEDKVELEGAPDTFEFNAGVVLESPRMTEAG